MRVVGKNWPSTKAIQALVAPIETNIVLSWGISAEGAFGGKPRIDGFEQLVRFTDSGVNAPEFTLDPSQAYSWVEAGHTVLGRRRNHSQGKDVVFINRVHPSQWPLLSDYWVKAVKNVVDEWRIHVLNGWYIGQGRKVNTLNDQSPVPIRSRKRGWKIDHTTMPPQYVKDLAKLAVKSLGYDFGAVDVLQLSSDTACVLEVNKAPGVDDYTASRYVRALERMVNDRNS